MLLSVRSALDAILEVVALVLEKEKGVFVKEILIDEIATGLKELCKNGFMIG